LDRINWANPADLRERLKTGAFIFRGYNVTNLGRSAEFLEHPAYGPIVERHLREMSEITSEAIGEKIDLVARVRQRRESVLESFGEDVGLIVGMELAQLEILEQFFDVPWNRARIAFGYSLGEVAALIASGVYKAQHILEPPLLMAKECIELARDCTMGVLFSRGPELSYDNVQRLCLEINAEGQGVIGISAFLSPNTMLLLGQGTTIDRFKQRMKERVSDQVHLRKNEHRWPPLHTPIVWQCHLPNRAALHQHVMPGGFVEPKPPLISLVTGKASYNDYNSREILNKWIDHPQRLWDAVCETLAAGVETVIHVGPDPNLVPATFQRLSDNVTAQLRGRSPARLGRRAMSRIVRRPWLTKVLSTRAILLRAPFVEQVNLEDWLLDQKLK
jgi:[acyl-carrier-protein] S-malonyltransferase